MRLCRYPTLPAFVKEKSLAERANMETGRRSEYATTTAKTPIKQCVSPTNIHIGAW